MRKKISIIKYLAKYNIDADRIASRHIQILMMMYEFLKVYRHSSNVKVNRSLLKMAIIDYFTDIVRIKDLHKIGNTNREKIYGYMAYWILRRKPIQAINDFKECEYVNELFVTFYVMSLVSKARKIDNNMKNNHPSFNEFQSYFYYNLIYRPVTQQSLELTIDAFLCGYDFSKLKISRNTRKNNKIKTQ